MREDNKHVEYLEGERGDGEEVDRNHTAKVIAKEGFAVLGRGPPGTWDHVFGDSALGNDQAQFEEFPVDSGSTPKRIGATHLPDQADDVRGDGFPTEAAGMACPSPEESKSGSMPSNDAAGLDQAKPGFPSVPSLRKPGPKGTVQRRQASAMGAAVEDQKLVSQSEILEEQVSPGLQSGKTKTEPEGQPTDHVH